MKLRIIAAAVLAASGTSASAMDYTDTAQVMSVTPIVERVVEPRQECVSQSAPAQPQERSMAGAVVGGVAGGLLGAQVGRGSGRTAAAAAGAIAGAVIGDRVDNRPTASAPQAQRCRTIETTREVIRGYTVVYRYNDRDITTTLPYDPGRTVTVGIGVIDARRDATAGMMGGNVREAQAPAPVNRPVPVNAPANGDYSYRY